MAFKMKYKNLEKIVDELQNASKMHKRQAKIVDKHIDKMQSPIQKYASDAQRKAIYASKAENSPAKKKGPCWEGYEMIGMKNKGGRKVPNCVPKKKN